MRYIFGQCRECNRLLAASLLSAKDAYHDVQEFMGQGLIVTIQDTCDPVTIEEHEMGCSERGEDRWK